MPIQSCALQKSVTLRSELSSKRFQERGNQQQDTDEDMEPMEASQNKKARAHDRRGVEPKSFVMKIDPLQRLVSQKERSQKDGHQKEADATLGILDQPSLGKMEGKTAGNQAEGGDDRLNHRRGVLQCLRHLPTGPGAATQDHVTADQASKQHRFGRQESEHSESDNVRAARVYFVNGGSWSLHG